jgi:hypothetical protein
MKTSSVVAPCHFLVLTKQQKRTTMARQWCHCHFLCSKKRKREKEDDDNDIIVVFSFPARPQNNEDK